MAGLKHDAKVCRDQAKSDLIRRTNGWLTPAEIAKDAQADADRKKVAAKKAAKGSPLFDVE